MSRFYISSWDEKVKFPGLNTVDTDGYIEISQLDVNITESHIIVGSEGVSDRIIGEAKL